MNPRCQKNLEGAQCSRARHLVLVVSARRRALDQLRDRFGIGSHDDVGAATHHFRVLRLRTLGHEAQCLCRNVFIGVAI